MTSRKLIIMGVVTVVAVGAALWSTQTRQPGHETAGIQPLVPELEKRLNDVTEVRVRGAEDQLLLTLVRGEAGWTLKEKGGYPADVSKLRAYLLKLAQAKRVEAKTSNPARYDRLGLQDMAAKDATGTQIELDGIEPPLKLIIGQNVSRGSGTYIRFTGDPQSWQIDTDLALERTPANWLLRDIADVATSRIQSATITPTKGAAIKIVRAPDDSSGEFVLADLPKGREPASDYVADATAGLFAGLRLDDVFPASEAEPPAEGVTRAQFRTEEGLLLDITSWSADNQTLARLDASLDETAANAFVQRAIERAEHEREAAAAAAKADASAESKQPQAPEASAESAPPATDPAQEHEQRLRALREEVAKLDAKFSGWTFVLPPYKADNLNKASESYLKPKSE